MSIIDGEKLELADTLPEVVHEHVGLWWFYDETWSERIGPYVSECQARRAVDRYCVEALGYPDPVNPDDVELTPGGAFYSGVLCTVLFLLGWAHAVVYSGSAWAVFWCVLMILVFSTPLWAFDEKGREK